MTIHCVLRSDQKTGGLFDTPGLEKKVTTTEIKDELATDDLWESINVQSFSGEAGGISLDENSLDQFMDLSQFLTQEPLEFGQAFGTLADADIQALELTSKPGSLKRSASVVSDHDYVLKKPRVSEPAPVVTEQVDVPVASTSATDDTPQSPGLGSSSVYPPADRYKERRRKNNIASRRSREIRKQKFVDMEHEADKLERDNQRLEAKITEMEKLAKEMKATLVKCLVQKK